jgi:hypothetical protein
MRTELNTLKRRPFLFPLLMPIAMMAIAVVAAVWVFDARATTVIVITRHAEVDVAADSDPNLTLAGKERAARLARVLAQLQTPRAVDAIFAADTRRCRLTSFRHRRGMNSRHGFAAIIAVRLCWLQAILKTFHPSSSRLQVNL